MKATHCQTKRSGSASEPRQNCIAHRPVCEKPEWDKNNQLKLKPPAKKIPKNHSKGLLMVTLIAVVAILE